MEELNLEYLRHELDDIDTHIIELFVKRRKLAGAVAAYKKNVGKAVLDPVREKQKLKSVKALVEDAFDKEAVEELYNQIMTISRRYQYISLDIEDKQGFSIVDGIETTEDTKVVYQGVEGSYSHQVAKVLFPNTHIQHATQFADAVELARTGEADYAVIPIENSTAGVIVDTYDLLIQEDVYIVSEYFKEISHKLLGIKGSVLSDIQTVYSHPQALMQCSNYLQKHREWRQISLLNTAVSAQKIRDEQDRTQAAIASKEAATLYGLDILEENINNYTGNTTRFVVLSRKKTFTQHADKISMVFELPHVYGSLYNALGHFIFNGLNMLNIESRPIPDRKFEYRFFVDIEGNLKMKSVLNAINALKSEAGYFKILGNY